VAFRLEKICIGFGAGLVGTAALFFSDRAERRLVGHEPPYAPARIASRWAQQVASLLPERRRLRWPRRFAFFESRTTTRSAMGSSASAASVMSLFPRAQASAAHGAAQITSQQSVRRDALMGAMLRWTYGPALGVLSHLLFARFHPARRALFTSAAILAFELCAMPATGATPPISTWRRRELLLLAVHTTVFGVATAAAAMMLSSLA
jgi:hypothetical protein